MLNPEKRAEKIDELLAEAKAQTEELKFQQEELRKEKEGQTPLSSDQPKPKDESNSS